MSHYSLDEWENYVNNSINEDKRIEMENHLFTCDHCLEVYMNTLDDSNVYSEALGYEFTNKITKAIKNDIRSSEIKKSKTYPSNILLYYTAAASITLFLMSQGFFTAITRGIPQTTVHIMNSSKYVEKISQNSWADTFIQKTMSIFDR